MTEQAKSAQSIENVGNPHNTGSAKRRSCARYGYCSGDRMYCHGPIVIGGEANEK